MYNFTFDDQDRVHSVNVVAEKLVSQDVDALVISVDQELNPLDVQSFEVMFEIKRDLLQKEQAAFPYYQGVITIFDWADQTVLMVDEGISSREAIDLHSIFLSYVSAMDYAADSGAKSIALPLLGLRYTDHEIAALAKALSDSLAFSVRSAQLEVTVCVSSPGQAKALASSLEKEIRAEKQFENLLVSSGNEFKNSEKKANGKFRQRCPECCERMLPITYGLPSKEDFEDPNFYSGGCIIRDGNPDWACRACELEF